MGRMPRSGKEVIAWQKAGCPDWNPRRKGKPPRKAITLPEEIYDLLKERQALCLRLGRKLSLPKVVELYLRQGVLAPWQIVDFQSVGGRPGRPLGTKLGSDPQPTVREDQLGSTEDEREADDHAG